MIFSEAKPEMKAKDDKMLTLERVTFLDVLVRQNDMSMPNFSSHCCFSSLKTPPSEEKCWQTRPEQHRSPNSNSSQTLLGTVYSKRNVKMQNESTRKSRNLCLTEFICQTYGEVLKCGTGFPHTKNPRFGGPES